MRARIHIAVFIFLSLVVLPGLADERPNIVLIIADELGFSDGGAPVQCPALSTPVLQD
jgi:hypothetical protein